MTFWRFRISRIATLFLAVAAFVAFPFTANAGAVYGTLSNFDVWNDTTFLAHGFEIELDGLKAKDITYEFSSPYIRYGKPTLTDFAGGVYVRYESPFDAATQSFTQTTQKATNPQPTPGHQCWLGGSGKAYENSGCEHFGLGMLGSPTNTVYRWMVAGLAPGSLTTVGGTVNLPAPVWSATPPVVPGPQPVVMAVIVAPPAPPAEVVPQFGEAIWMKSFYVEQLAAVELNQLVSEDPIVPQGAAELEVNWTLLQALPVNGGAVVNPKGVPQIDSVKAQGAATEAIVRRYEFYKYTGGYVQEDHEALFDTYAPELAGQFIGAQDGGIQPGRSGSGTGHDDDAGGRPHGLDALAEGPQNRVAPDACGSASSRRDSC